MTDAELRQLREEMRAAASEIRRHASTVALAVPATWDMAMLREHYRGLSEDRIKALLRDHCGYSGKRGQAIAVHVDQVRRLDAILGTEGVL